MIAGVLQRLVTFWVSGSIEAWLVSLVVMLQGFVVFVFAAAIDLERASTRRLIGLAIGLAGVATIMLTRGSLADGLGLWLLVALLLPVLFSSESILIAARRPAGVDFIAMTGFMMAASAAFLFPIAYGAGGLLVPEAGDGRLEMLVLAIGIISAASVVLAFHLVVTAGAVFASISAYSMTIAGVFWGMLLLGEELPLLELWPKLGDDGLRKAAYRGG